jgi:hypothetical protein
MTLPSTPNGHRLSTFGLMSDDREEVPLLVAAASAGCVSQGPRRATGAVLTRPCCGRHSPQRVRGRHFRRVSHRLTHRRAGHVPACRHAGDPDVRAPRQGGLNANGGSFPALRPDDVQNRMLPFRLKLRGQLVPGSVVEPLAVKANVPLRGWAIFTTTIVPGWSSFVIGTQQQRDLSDPGSLGGGPVGGRGRQELAEASCWRW